MHTVLYVSHTSQIGGGEHSLLLLLRGLDRQRFRPLVALPGAGPFPNRLDALGVPHRTVSIEPIRRTRHPAALLGQFLAWRRAIAEIATVARDVGAHLVHANSTTAHLFAGPAARRAKVPCVWHVRDASSPGGWLDRRMTRNATAIVAVSGAVRDALLHPRLAGPKTCVIHNGVDTDAFAPAAPSPVRQELGIGAKAPVAGIVGQIVPWKGHERFLDAAAAVAARLPAAKFLIAGDNRFGDFPTLPNALRRKAEASGLGDKVLFLGWRDDAAAVMNALDVLVVASEQEPFGRVVIEAMACGKPVVSFRVGGPVEIVEDEKTGLLLPPYDTQAMADALVGLLSERKRSATMGRSARDMVCRKFSAAAHTAAVQDLYDRLLA